VTVHVSNVSYRFTRHTRYWYSSQRQDPSTVAIFPRRLHSPYHTHHLTCLRYSTPNVLTSVLQVTTSKISSCQPKMQRAQKRHPPPATVAPGIVNSHIVPANATAATIMSAMQTTIPASIDHQQLDSSQDEFARTVTEEQYCVGFLCAFDHVHLDSLLWLILVSRWRERGDTSDMVG